MRRLAAADGVRRAALVVLACLSGVATALVIHDGTRRTLAQTAALAALAHRPGTTTVVARAPAPRVTAVTTSSSSSPARSTAPRHVDHGAGGGAGQSTGAPSTAAAPAPVAPSTTASQSSTTPPPTTASSATTTTPAPDAGLPRVAHAFVIALSVPTYRSAFGTGSAAPYLRSLTARGTVLTDYESLGHGELADELAMVSGQAPNRDTSAGCRTFREYPSSANADAAGEVPGAGCVYPESAITIADQISSDGKTWGAYVAGMGSTACVHPNSGDPLDVPLPGTDPGYDVIHNPFVFFHSLLDMGGCQSSDRDLGRLGRALAARSRTPRLTYVGADACADGDPVMAPPPSTSTTTSTTTSPTTSSTTATTSGPAAPAAYGCPAGDTAGIASEDAFLKLWVPRILRSAAYRAGGVLVIALTGSASPGHPVRTGALVLSPHTRRGARISRPYGPYSLLRSLEDMLDDTPLAHAAHAPSFAAAVL